jgi:hypothetical protein
LRGEVVQFGTCVPKGNCRSRVRDEEYTMAPWDKYRSRYNARPETFDAYVDAWKRVPEAQACFGGWVGFTQAANAEPTWVEERPERVHAAEEFMREAGYEIGPPTDRGARRWMRVAPRPRIGTLKLFRLKITI